MSAIENVADAVGATASEVTTGGGISVGPADMQELSVMPGTPGAPPNAIPLVSALPIDQLDNVTGVASPGKNVVAGGAGRDPPAPASTHGMVTVAVQTGDVHMDLPSTASNHPYFVPEGTVYSIDRARGKTTAPDGTDLQKLKLVHIADEGYSTLTNHEPDWAQSTKLELPVPPPTGLHASDRLLGTDFHTGGELVRYLDETPVGSLEVGGVSARLEGLGPSVTGNAASRHYGSIPITMHAEQALLKEVTADSATYRAYQSAMQKNGACHARSQLSCRYP